MRARRAPTNPNTEPQQAIRSAVALLANMWTTTLSAQQREDWETYAFNTPTLNSLGFMTKKSGQNMFIRGNVPRLQALLTPALDAPTVFDTGTLTEPTALVADDSTNQITFAFTDTDPWANDADGALLVYQSRPQNASRNFFKGPYQLATRVLGATPTPPTSPATFTSLFPLTTGQRVFLKFNATTFDGRYSNTIRLDAIVVP